MIFQSFYSMWLRKRTRFIPRVGSSSFHYLWGHLVLSQYSLAGLRLRLVGSLGGVAYKKTRDAVSAHGDLQMSISLLCFLVVYSLVFGFGYYYAIHQIKKGPDAIEHDEHDMTTVSGRI